MNEVHGNHRGENDRQAHLRNLEARLAGTTATLNYVKSKIKNATVSASVHASEQLLKAEHQADYCIANLRKQLDLLASADEGSWDDHRFSVDMAGDDLSQAIKKIVERFP